MPRDRRCGQAQRVRRAEPVPELHQPVHAAAAVAGQPQQQLGGGAIVLPRASGQSEALLVSGRSTWGNDRYSCRRLPLRTVRIPVSGGVEALPGHGSSGWNSRTPAACRRLRLDRALSGELGVPVAGLLRMRAAVTRAVHRPGIHRLQPPLHRARCLRWGVMKNADDNPVARSNVIPPMHGPSEPSFYAFCFALALSAARQDRSSSRAVARQATAPRHTRAHSAPRRGQPRRHARQGRVRVGADGRAHGRAGEKLGRLHGDPGVFGPRRARHLAE